MPEVKNPIGTADLEWIFARNREDTEPLHYKKKRKNILLKFNQPSFSSGAPSDIALLSTAR